MSDLDDFIAEVRNGLRNMIGDEGLEQFMLDEAWIQETFRECAITNLHSSCGLNKHGAGGIYIVNSAFYSGINAYRRFMIDKGVDVLNLEGRV